MTEKVLTIDQICEAFGFSPATLHRLRGLGEFPPGFKIGRARRWTESAIAQWMSNRQNPEQGKRAKR